MIIGVDVGNTNINFGIFENYEIVSSFRITTNLYLTSDEIGVRIRNIFQSKNYSVDDIEDIIIASVVPSIMKSLIEGIREYLKKDPIVIKNDMDLGINICVDYPNEVGVDRIVDMVAVNNIYGSPAVVVDFGTANTYDLLDNNKCYIAGLITPGIRTSLYGLIAKAAKLTNIEIDKPKTIFAKNTKDAMNAGIIFGQVGEFRYIVDKYLRRVGNNAKVILTGGLGELIVDYVSDIAIYDKELTLKGLYYCYRRIKNEDR